MSDETLYDAGKDTGEPNNGVILQELLTLQHQAELRVRVTFQQKNGARIRELQEILDEQSKSSAYVTSVDTGITGRCPHCNAVVGDVHAPDCALLAT